MKRPLSTFALLSNCILTLLCVLATPALGQLPDAPSHKFWDHTNKVLIATDGAAKGLDGYWTHRALDGEVFRNRCYTDPQGVIQCPLIWIKRGHEANPLARPFVGSTAGQIGFFAGTWGADVGAAYLFHRTGHHKLERAVLSVGIGSSVTGAAMSAHCVYSF